MSKKEDVSQDGWTYLKILGLKRVSNLNYIQKVPGVRKRKIEGISLTAR